jgi:DNA ligase (NAD+)
MKIEDIKKRILAANSAYRAGKPIISDSEYDLLLEELEVLSPNDELLLKVGIEISDSVRKVELPIAMASMNKTKSIDEIASWCRLKGINPNEEIILTPKYDGLSFCVNELTSEAYTRGDGKFGQRANDHYMVIQNHLYEDLNSRNPFMAIPFEYTYGEVIMPKSVFISKYSDEFANPRNLVAGLINSKEATLPLSDCQYIKYGAVTRTKFSTKKEVLDELNNGQKVKVDNIVCKISDLSEDLFLKLFTQWSAEYEIDGIIIEINNLELQEKLGRETSSNNPVWARAYKSPDFEQSAETEILDISWNISKGGLVKPVAHVRPIQLDGVTVSNVTLNNARYVKDMGLGIGATVKIKRSGFVIPKITEVLKTVDFTMPIIPGIEIDWNENGVELITLTETDEQKFKQIVSFFEILEVDNVGEGVVKQLWDSGYITIKDILNLSVSDFLKIDRFGKRKAQIVYDSIHSKLSSIELSKVQHASGLFGGSLGSKKLKLLEHFTEKPTISQILTIDGFAELSAMAYINGYDKFQEFVKDLPIKFKEVKKVEIVGGDLEGKIFVFTGVRDKELEKIIEMRGGRIGGTVSKNTTHLVMKSKGSGSSKENKAIDLGIEIMEISELVNFLG